MLRDPSHQPDLADNHRRRSNRDGVARGESEQSNSTTVTQEALTLVLYACTLNAFVAVEDFDDVT